MTDPYWIAGAGQADSVETLLILKEYGHDWTDYADDLAATAARNGRPRLLKYILDESLILDRANLSRALESAVQAGSLAAVILLLAHRADATADNSAALRAAIATGQLATAHQLLKAGARITDLPKSALVQTFEGGDVPLAIELLRGGVAVNDAAPSPFTAWRLTREISPEAWFFDEQGKRHAKPIREKRLLYCRAIAEQALKYPGGEAVELTVWLSKLLAASGQ